MERILRKPDVEAMTGFVERQLRDMERNNKFPKRFVLNEGGRAVGWLASEVDAWIKLRAATRDQAAA